MTTNKIIPAQSNNSNQSNTASHNSLSSLNILTGAEDKIGGYKTKNYRKSLVSQTQFKSSRGWWRQTLRTKAALVAIAIGVLPILVVGSVAYYAAQKTFTENAIASERERAVSIEEEMEIFLENRLSDIQVLAELDVFTNPRVRASVTRQDLDSALNSYASKYDFYHSIAVFDLDGNVLAQTEGKPLLNHSSRDYFKKVLATDIPIVSAPTISKTSGLLSLYSVAPIKDSVTDKTIAIVRARIPVSYLKETFDFFFLEDRKFYLVDPKGKILLSDEFIGFSVEDSFPNLNAQVEQSEFNNTPIEISQEDENAVSAMDKHKTNNQEVLAAYVAFDDLDPKHFGLANGAVISASNTDVIFAPQRYLLSILVWGIGLATVVVGFVAAYIAKRTTQPILEATDAVTKLGQGNLDTRLKIQGEDELAILGFNINQMATQIQELLRQEEKNSLKSQMMADIARSRDINTLEVPLQNLLEDIRTTLKADRVVIYRFNTNWSGYIAGESVVPKWSRALGSNIEDPCISPELIEDYRNGRVVPTRNVFEAGFHPEHLLLMQRLQVKSSLVVPIRQRDNLFGLMIAHHCEQFHDWQHSEINDMQESADQLGLALSGLALFEQQQAEAQRQRQQKESLQLQLTSLLSEIEGASQGDLTVRAELSAGEIGIVADVFNSIVERLRKIVIQVKQASSQVNTSIGNNEGAIRQLADESLAQVDEISQILNSVEQMSDSIQEVASSASQAAEVARSASSTAQAGGMAMDRTVESISSLRSTVAETTKKVKQLGESSQQISQAVLLINEIATKTNLLAVNASIEAARAGEEGRGFAVVAEEVGELADQSVAATKEIEQIVKNIQTETIEVVKAMELGTTQVVEGSSLVNETKQSLGQILAVSAQIDDLLQSISEATVSQADTSQTVTNLMKQITQASQKNSEFSRQVAQSLQDTVQVAQGLEDAVDQFKVG